MINRACKVGLGSHHLEVYGVADGHGFAWQGERFFNPSPRPATTLPSEQGRVVYDGERITTELVFNPAATVRGQITDDSARPLVGAGIELVSFQNARSGSTSWSCRYLDSAPPGRGEADRNFEAAWMLDEITAHSSNRRRGTYKIPGYRATRAFLPA